MGKFVIKTRKNGEFQFNLHAGNGEIILTSEGYTTKSSCMNGIESVKTNSTDENRYVKNTSSNGKHYFNLRAGNNQIIGTSELYDSTSSRDKGIASVMNNAGSASIDDLT